MGWSHVSGGAKWLATVRSVKLVMIPPETNFPIALLGLLTKLGLMGGLKREIFLVDAFNSVVETRHAAGQKQQPQQQRSDGFGVGRCHAGVVFFFHSPHASFVDSTSG